MLKFNEITEQTTGVFEIYALIKSLELKLTRNGKDYMDMELQTKEGILGAKLWTVTEADKKNLKAGKVIQSDAQINIFNGVLSLSLTNPQVIDLDPDEFKLTAVEPVSILEKEFREIADSIKHPQLHEIVQRLMDEEEFKEKFFIWPAAKSHHHAEEHGLLMHTTRMLRLGEACIKAVNENAVKEVNRDLVLTGIIFHDVEKMDEMTPVEGTGAGEYTKEGILLGHIYMGARRIAAYEEEGLLDHEVSVQLQHIILAHHGKKEFGSPVEPHTPEAKLVNAIDDMDAKLFEIQTNMLRIREGEVNTSNWTYNPLPIE